MKTQPTPQAANDTPRAPKASQAPETLETRAHTFDILFPPGYVPTPERLVEVLLACAGNTAIDKMEATGMSEEEIHEYIPLHLDEITDFVLRILFHPAAVNAVRRAAEHHRSVNPTPDPETADVSKPAAFPSQP